MNNVRRKQIAQACQLLGQASIILEAVRDEEEQAAESASEFFPARAEQGEANTETLNEALESLEEIATNLHEL